jgi:hypothetical protein
MTLAITTVCTSIAALTVAGVTIKDLDAVPPSAIRLTPVLFPAPENPISNFLATRESFGGGSSALVNVEYDLNYIFLYCELGSGRTGLDWLEDRMLKVQAIYDEVLEIDVITGAVDVWPTGNVQFITLTDPAGNQYLGCAMTFHVTEFWR